MIFDEISHLKMSEMPKNENSELPELSIYAVIEASNGANFFSTKKIGDD